MRNTNDWVGRRIAFRRKRFDQQFLLRSLGQTGITFGSARFAPLSRKEGAARQHGFYHLEQLTPHAQYGRCSYRTVSFRETNWPSRNSRTAPTSGEKSTRITRSGTTRSGRSRFWLVRSR